MFYPAQFVPLRDHAVDAGGGRHVINARAVTKALLEELPGQLLDFMTQHRIMPNPAARTAPTTEPSVASLPFSTSGYLPVFCPSLYPVVLV